ncbi:translation initiation factor IF-2-like [Panicum virgatum]|uniref:Uncharacterized protein n=1 Tax=Panicum virgatum TaxID=38727 RepID=A0A8T0Q2I3_PANVG|nr:translation initiation factor IF-2-like [Panicum virgatum]KAG2564484.1 hypothetical protein PVAP13_7NG119712 [Panicum virgatum]
MATARPSRPRPQSSSSASPPCPPSSESSTTRTDPLLPSSSPPPPTDPSGNIINPYELRRLKNCMRIKARLEELGLPCSQKLYEALGDQSDDKQTESSNKTARKKTGSKRSSDDMSAAGISPPAAKRFAPAASQRTTRVTRSQKSAPGPAAAQPTKRGTRAAPPAPMAATYGTQCNIL